MRLLRLTAALAVALSTLFAAVGPIEAARADTLPPVLTISAPTTAAPFGAAFTVTGRLTVADVPVAGAAVQLQQQLASGEWQAVADAVTDADGRVAFAPAADHTAGWRLVHPADAVTAEAVSPTAAVLVRVALAADWVHSAVQVGKAATVRGTIGPATGTVRLQRLRNGTWHPAGTLTVAPDGTFHATVHLKKPGFATYRLVRSADATHLGAIAPLARLDVYRLHTYVVRSRGRVSADVAAFAASAAATYADPRGWLRAHHRFRRVSTGGDFTLLLAQARYLPTYSWVCSTSYSCRVGRFVIINETRWRRSSPFFTGDKGTYRSMVVNHETGHWLGRPHAFCTGRGNLAPVMQQQSKGMHGCRPNGWPLPREIRAVS